MAPEVVAQRRSNGHGIGYSVEVDWWSLGCIFFEMVVGYSPFAAASPEEVFANVENWKFVLPEVFDEACSIMSGSLCCILCFLRQSAKSYSSFCDSRIARLSPKVVV
jgi:serine/threonine protein kinase